jgi:hypothetical protein
VSGYRHRVSPLVTFGPGPAAALAAWLELHQIGRVIGLALLAAVATWLWLLLIVALVSAAEHPAALFAPASWRRAWRRGWLWRRAREGQGSAEITGFQRRVVYHADRHRCIYCHRRTGIVVLNIDHYCPWRAGARTVLRNLFTLCHDCNMYKSDYWPGRRYHPQAGYNNKRRAHAIWRRERIAAHSPVRLARLALAMAALS